MKSWIIVIGLLLCLELALSKTTVKPPKKFSSLKKKPTKPPPKSLVDQFKDLSKEDLEFIKELEKQFKENGDNIKIKVERENSTIKNSKRTIDGQLGYGYQDEQPYRYHFSQPKYMIYPYSQNDIPSTAPRYAIPPHQHSYDVTVQPSYSYEIKQVEQGYAHQQPQYQQYQPQYHQQPEPQQYQEPVIVLRVPGPAKYAAHLQALLRRYVEIRAAQFLRLIQENEARQQVQENTYADVPDFAQEHHQPEPQQDAHYQQQQPEQDQYQPIHDVYQSYKAKQIVPEYQYQQYEEEPVQQYVYAPAVTAPQHQAPQQQIVYVQQTQRPHTVYGIPQEYHQTTHHQQEQEDELPTTENNPRDSHTKVLFYKEKVGPQTHSRFTSPIHAHEEHDDGQKSSPVYSSAYAHQNIEEENYHQQQQQHESAGQPETHQQRHEEDYEQEAPQSNNHQEHVVQVTQKPFNYHAHSVNLRQRTAKRGIVSQEEQYDKLDKLIDRLKSKELIDKRLQ